MSELACPVLCIDGPTASGKGTVAQRVAEKLGFHYLDSGALYRLTALASERAGIDVNDIDALSQIAKKLPARFIGEHIFLQDEDVTELIRQENIGNRASALAVHGAVRTALVDLQRGFAQFPGLVADGRDMGTVIFPDAPLKVFLSATAEIRAERRFKQLSEKGVSVTFANLLQDLRERDQRDQSRLHAPLKPAENAKLLDTTGLTIDQAVKQVLDWWAISN